ncbi:MAG: peptidoglycan-binding protein [Hyphomicrobiales bacterium]|nr:MAG: peptidoglycan-binding protein [Hyphomicrobiales bacterium]
MADPHPKGFEAHKFNGSVAPVTEDGVTTFRIQDGECSKVDFGDGRGESDCLNGTVRSVLGHSPQAELGQTLEYRFDVRVDPSLAYEGYLNNDSAGHEPGAWDSHLWLASWEGTFLHNFIYILKVSKKAGITFAGQVCQPPEKLGDWVSFSMKVKWGGDDKAWVAVTCDDRYVFASEGAPSNVAPNCYVQNQCVVGEVRNPKRLLFIPGVKMSGWGHSWKDIGKDSAFIPIQPEGITAQMRNMAVTSGAVLYGPAETALVVKLQEALNALGCDVGKADGVPGKKTRLAALTCRKLADGAMPAQLNVATVQTFVELYAADGVADLPPGELPPEPLVIHVHQSASENDSLEGQMATSIIGTVSGAPGVEELGLLLIGEYNAARGRFDWLNLLLLDDIAKQTGVKDCPGVRIEDWGNGGVHAVVDFSVLGKSYFAKSADCLISKLPENTAREAEFVLTNFGDIARSMVADGTLPGVTHPGLRGLLESVAAGDITIQK